MEETNGSYNTSTNGKMILKITVIVALTLIVIFSILRERFVANPKNQITVIGQGKLTYTPDLATVRIGIQVDRMENAQDALTLLSRKMTQVVAAIKAAGIPAEDIQTQNYTLTPQNDYKDGVTTPAGYSANQNLTIKVRTVDVNKEHVSSVVSAANGAGANDIKSITFESSKIGELREKAKIAAIEDSKTKSKELARAAGISLGKIVGWYDSNSEPIYNANDTFAAAEMNRTSMQKAQPEIPQGDREVIVNLNVNYEIK